MKINSSDIHFSSTTQFIRTTEEALYTLDMKGDILHKDQKNLTEAHRSAMTANFRTREDYSVELKQASESESLQYMERDNTSFTDLDNDFEKNMYLGSVLSWAADSIDRLVSVFEGKINVEEQALEKQNQGFDVPFLPGNMTSFSSEAIDTGKKRFEIYRKMASALRIKAEKLSPDVPERSANRIRRSTKSEKQRTIVQTSGLIHTADGQKIDFSLDIDMHRESQSLTVETFQIIDPLVINFSGTAVRLADETFSFDLDSDGVTEDIAQLQSGSGFLSLDLNGDGVINNGKELFGPTMGDGFKELALFDDDNNHWIDENDDIFKKLTVWIKDGSGKDILHNLSEAGIGAIHIGAVNSDFLLKNSTGDTMGQVSSTGIALSEAGAIKTIQQIDLII